jgi:hypothetical protein
MHFSFRRKKAISEGQDDSLAPRKTFPTGLKLLHNPIDASIEYVTSWIQEKTTTLTLLFSIVFIHGLNGDREATWTAKDEDHPWSKTLLPHRIPTARILTFGYDAGVAKWIEVVSQSRIKNHAMDLLSALSAHRGNDGTVR